MKNMIYIALDTEFNPYNGTVTYLAKIGCTGNIVQRALHYISHTITVNIVDTKNVRNKYKSEEKAQKKLLKKTKSDFVVKNGVKTEWVVITEKQFFELDNKGFKWLGL